MRDNGEQVLGWAQPVHVQRVRQRELRQQPVRQASNSNILVLYIYIYIYIYRYLYLYLYLYSYSYLFLHFINIVSTYVRSLLRPPAPHYLKPRHREFRQCPVRELGPAPTIASG